MDWLSGSASFSPAPVHSLPLTCPGKRPCSGELRSRFAAVYGAARAVYTSLSPHQAYVCLDTERRDAHLPRNAKNAFQCRHAGRASEEEEECLLVGSAKLGGVRRRVLEASCGGTLSWRSLTSDPVTQHPGMRAIQNSRVSVCAPQRRTFSFKSSCGMTGRLLSPSLSLAFLPSFVPPAPGASAACFGLRRRVWAAGADRPGPSPSRSGPGKQTQEEEECSDVATSIQQQQAEQRK